VPDLPVPWIDGYLWQAGYLRQIAQRVDQVVLMSYDSDLPLVPLYHQFRGALFMSGMGPLPLCPQPSRSDGGRGHDRGPLSGTAWGSPN
jgi:hypothetical protein